MKKFSFIALLMFFIGSFATASEMDVSAGYDDGCLSAKGHFTKSNFAFDNIMDYRKGWLQGNKECGGKSRKKASSRKHKYKKRYSSKRRHHKRATASSYCKSNPWVSFSKGWEDGYRSAQGRWRKLSGRCQEYERGWYEGYNQCKCQEVGECVEVSAVY